MQSFVNARNLFFSLKDIEISLVIDKLKKRDQLEDENMHVSYGLLSEQMKDENDKVITDKYGNHKMEHALVINLPYFSQLAVHIKQKESISALCQTPYDTIPLIETKTVMLTNEMSRMQEDKNNDIMKKIKEKGLNAKGKDAEREKFVIEEVRKMYNLGTTVAQRNAVLLAIKMGFNRESLHKVVGKDEGSKGTNNDIENLQDIIENDKGNEGANDDRE